MHHPNRCYLNCSHMKSLSMVDSLYIDIWHPAISVRGKTVRNALPDHLLQVRFHVQVYGTETRKWPQVVNSSHMVIMLVCEQVAVYFTMGKVHYLLPEIRSAIDHQEGIVHFDTHG